MRSLAPTGLAEIANGERRLQVGEEVILRPAGEGGHAAHRPRMLVAGEAAQEGVQDPVLHPARHERIGQFLRVPAHRVEPEALDVPLPFLDAPAAEEPRVAAGDRLHRPADDDLGIRFELFFTHRNEENLERRRGTEIEFLTARDVPEVVRCHRQPANAGGRGIHQREPEYRRILRGTAADEQAGSPVFRGELHPRRLAKVKAALERATTELERLLHPARGPDRGGGRHRWS